MGVCVGRGQGDLSYLIVGRSAVAPASNLKGCWDQFCDFLLDYFEEFQPKKTFFSFPPIHLLITELQHVAEDIEQVFQCMRAHAY